MTTTNSVRAIAFVGSDLYVGGDFTISSSTYINYLARWDGANWSAVGTGVNSTVSSLAVIGSDLYVGGGMTTAGGIQVNHIAKWDGANWSALGSGTGTGPGNGLVNSLAASGGTLYVGGNFTTAGQNYSSSFGIWQAPILLPPQLNVSYFADGNLVLSWNSRPNVNYQLFSTPDLSQPFSPLISLIPSAGATTSYTNLSIAGSARFFRIVQ